MNFDPYEAIRNKAKELGFVSVGFIRPKTPLFFDYFLKWIKDGKNADMQWLERYIDIRRDPAKILKDCNTIISLAYPYSPDIPATLDNMCTARYTEPLKEDYHTRLKKIGKRLCKSISEFFPEAKFRICVDSAPVLERSIAYMSGVGFFGKNNMLIVPGYGSYVFLMEIFTTAFIPFPEPSIVPDQCGECEKCINACPTGALKKPYCFDARLCLSYITIEDRSDSVKESFAEKMSPFFVGCDRCQQVCPFNKKGNLYICLPKTEEFLRMDKSIFKKRFGNTALSRAGLYRIKRNIKAILSTKVHCK